jgi:hypothetical protein
MDLSSLQNDLKEIETLSLYRTKIQSMLDQVLTCDSVVSAINIGIKDVKKPEKPPVVEHNGKELSWEGFPEELKKVPFLVVPGATLRKQPKFDEQFDLELTPELLTSILLYFLKNVNSRLKILTDKISQNGKT